MASRSDVIGWVSRAWDKVSQEVISNSFKLCSLSTALDGSEDHMLSNNVLDALNAAEELGDEVNEEAAALLFADSDSGSDTDLSFEGFSESEI